MKYLKFTLKERKLITMLMVINSFALFVNYFGLSPKIRSGNTEYYLCLFTNAVKNDKYLHRTNLVQYNSYEFEDKFFPFVKYYSSWYEGSYFNGIFPYYDISEFLVYTLVIFGFFILRKVLTDKEVK